MDERFSDVLKNRHVLPKIEALKDHAQTGSKPNHLIHVSGGRIAGPVSRHPNRLALDCDGTSIRNLQKIDTTKKGALTRTRRTQHRYYIANGCI